MMDDMACTVRFSIRPQPDGWRWETYDASGARRAGGLVRTKAIAAAMVIRDTCAAQTSHHLISAATVKAEAA